MHWHTNLGVLAVAALVCLAPPEPAFPAGETLGQLEFAPAGKTEKHARVWVDGTYVGTAGSIKVMLVPGEHKVEIRYPGYRDMVSTVPIEAGTQLTLPVRLEPDRTAPAAVTASEKPGRSSEKPETSPSRSTASAEMRIVVRPNRAAVFLNGAFVGRVDEFDGIAQGMVLPPGTYQVRIALAGYRPFETTLTLLPGQKFELKTHLFEDSAAGGE